MALTSGFATDKRRTDDHWSCFVRIGKHESERKAEDTRANAFRGTMSERVLLETGWSGGGRSEVQTPSRCRWWVMADGLDGDNSQVRDAQ